MNYLKFVQDYIKMYRLAEKLGPECRIRENWNFISIIHTLLKGFLEDYSYELVNPNEKHQQIKQAIKAIEKEGIL